MSEPDSVPSPPREASSALRTRLWMGTLLVLLAVGILVLDLWLAPWYPILLGTALLATTAGCFELVDLLPSPAPRRWVCVLGVAAVVFAAWPAPIARDFGWDLGRPADWALGALAGLLLTAFLVEAATFLTPGGAVQRLGLAFWVVGYVGLLAWFFLRLRWLPGAYGSLALALAIFVPKCCDIGAYFAGRFLGRHHMAPVLSPKKTWEGAAGGLVGSALAALGINALGPSVAGGVLLAWPSALGFGVVAGLAGMLGDLMESLLKRDCQRKDTSAIMPGFGGVLDVLDSILFAAPVCYLWLTLGTRLPGVEGIEGWRGGIHW